MALENLFRKLAKITYYPFKYRRGEGYDAESYWRDRLSKHGMAFRGVGHEGLDEQRNRLIYEQSLREFVDILKQAKIEFAGKKIMEIGVGNGFYLDFCARGSSCYWAIDITDVLFPELAKQYPNVHFLKADVCKMDIKEKFDIILMIDVLEHIVTENNLRSALYNLKGCLSDNGVLILGPVLNKAKKHLFYVRFWDMGHIMQYFHEHPVEVYRPFKNGALLVIRSPRH